MTLADIAAATGASLNLWGMVGKCFTVGTLNASLAVSMRQEHFGGQELDANADF